MPTISVTEADLVKRSNSLYRLFSPLRVNDATRVACGFAKDSPGRSKVLVASDGTTRDRRYREETFRTSIPDLRCKYFEVWQPGKANHVVLNRAYLTLLRVGAPGRDFEELIALHTDPDDSSDMKQGPHLHVTCAPDPMHHCHFPLAWGFLTQVLRNCDSLTVAFGLAIKMIAQDVLPRYRTR